MNRKSTYGLKLEQLADLFSIGIEEEESMDEICNDEKITQSSHKSVNSALQPDLL